MCKEREKDLINVAECHPDDRIAEMAMQKLRDNYDSSYGWCSDCDGLVVKESECCLNNI